MKKILALIVGMVLFLQSFTVSEAASTTNTLNISVLDASGNVIDLSDSSYHFGVGGSTINAENGSRKNGYSIDNIQISFKDGKIVIQTAVQEDIDFTIYKEVNSELIHISDLVKTSAFINGTANKVYKLNELKKLSISTSCEGETSASYHCFLFKQGIKMPVYDEIMGSFCFLDTGNTKTIYVTSGKYNATFIGTKDSKVYVYQKKDIDATKNTSINVIQKTSELIHNIVTVPSIYSEYPYYRLHLSMETGETVFYGDLIHNNKIDVYSQKLAFSWKSLTLSNTLNYDYNRSIHLTLNGDINLSGSYYFYKLSGYRSYDGQSMIITPEFKDLNGNILRLIDIERPEKYYMEVFDSSGKAVLQQAINEYSFEFDRVLQAGSYTVKTYSITDAACSYVSNFALVIDKTGGTSFTFKGKDARPAVINLKELTHDIKNGNVNFSLPINNDLGLSLDLDVDLLSANAGSGSLTSQTIAAKSKGTINFTIPAATFKEADNSYVNFEINGIVSQQVPVSTLIYNDIEGNWAKDTILDLTLKGIVFPKTGNSYEPGANITRAEFATFLANALALTNGTENITFTDVPTTNPYYNAIMMASSNKIINGYPNGTFGPDKQIIRQDAAVIINNVFNYLGTDLSGLSSVTTFVDSNQIGSYAQTAVGISSGSGILTGKPGNKFDPKNSMTRAEAAVIVSRLLQYLGK